MEKLMGPQMYWGGWTKEGGGGSRHFPPPHFLEHPQADSMPPILLPRQICVHTP